MIKVGLLSFYLKLYDDTSPTTRKEFDGFMDEIKKLLKDKGLHIVASPVCRIEKEFEEAAKLFDAQDVDAVVTLHLAYSPSLESANVLKSLKVPVIVLDTTPDESFSMEQTADRIMFNHGIHGVQDMCNLLLRNGVPFHICAGHYKTSDCLDRVAIFAKAAHMAKRFKTCNIGIIGSPFAGMGDFGIGFDVMKESFGFRITPFPVNEYRRYADMINEEDIRREYERNLERFVVEVEPEYHKKALLPNLVVRKWMEENRLDGFTANFLDIRPENGFTSMPFLEASEQLSIGKGYAGEGDVLTAALTASLMSVFKNTSFMEMFCPDWRNNAIFVSHMGEMNLNLCHDKPILRKKPFPYTDAEDPIAAYGGFRAGTCILTDLAPAGGGKYNLILSKVQMLEPQVSTDLKNSIHGWFKPEVPLPEFLEEYSRNGGTHHLACVYTDELEILKAFGKMMGFHVVVI
jgi:L-arabinose isomerase